MKRRPRKLLQLAAMLLAGAIVNIAVAWGICVLSANVPFRTSTAHPVNSWPEPVPANWPSSSKVATARSWGMTKLWAYTPDGNYNQHVEAYGLPARSMQVEHWLYRQDNAAHKFTSMHGVRIHQSLRRTSNANLFIPTLPLWPGFAINTIFYAAVFWLLFIAPGLTKRTLRRRRGQCPACGYRIAPGTAEVCSECGEALTVPESNATKLT